MPAKLKAYYLHNIDGRRCGMIAATSKKAVREVVRIPPEEIAWDVGCPVGQALALASPGVLFVQPIGSREPAWTADTRYSR